MSQSDPIVVIGAGIIGAATARALQREGHAITLIDSAEPGMGTSYGNAGYIAITPVLPLARPAILTRVPHMLMDRKGPLTIHLPSVPAMLPWMARFALAASSQVEVRKAIDAFDVLMREADIGWKEEIELSELGDLFRRKGALYVHDSEESFAATATERQMQRDWGVTFENVGGARAREIAPGLSPRIVRATYYPYGIHTINPQRVVSALAGRFADEGGTFLKGRVLGFVRDGGLVKAVALADRTLAAKGVVIAAGMASDKLTRLLGFKAPLVAQRGYHVMLAPDNLRFDLPVSFASRGFFITPMEEGLRLAGTVELAKTGRPPTWNRAEILIRHLKDVFPDVGGEVRSRWVGERPTLPDFRPAIGRAPSLSNVYCAYGHHHIGLTLATATARMIARQLAGEELPAALSGCDPGRFG